MDDAWLVEGDLCAGFVEDLQVVLTGGIDNGVVAALGHDDAHLPPGACLYEE